MSQMTSKIITSIPDAARQLRAGGLVGLPTETVYGLAADATQDSAVAKIFALKNRPHFNPLIIHAGGLDSALRLGLFNENALRLAELFWEEVSGLTRGGLTRGGLTRGGLTRGGLTRGGLTLVVPKNPTCPISPLALAGGDTIALRVPAHPMACALLQESELFLAAPSANPSGQLSPTTAAHVAKHFPDLLVLDGGAARLGLESTIVACLEPTESLLLRAGALTSAEIEKQLGSPLALPTADEKRNLSPGRLPRHYAPSATLRLNAEAPHAHEGFLGFGSHTSDYNLSPSGDMTEAAANFFAMLHALDLLFDAIAVAPIPQHGLGIAINDRLTRGATP